MKKITAILATFIVLVVATATNDSAVQTKTFEEARQQVENGKTVSAQSRSSQPQAAETDRYWREKARADEKHRIWEDNDSQMEDRIASLPTCSRDAGKVIAQIRDLAFESFDAQKAYYDTWLHDYQGDLSKLRDVMQQRGGLRRGIETDFTEANQELNSLIERRHALEVSTAAAKVRPGDEMKALDDLIANENKRVSDYQRALKQWDAAANDGKSATEILEQQKANIAQFKRLLDSSSAYWLAYYHAVDARAMLKAVANPRCGPQPPLLREPKSDPRPPVEN